MVGVYMSVCILAVRSLYDSSCLQLNSQKTKEPDQQPDETSAKPRVKLTVSMAPTSLSSVSDRI